MLAIVSPAKKLNFGSLAKSPEPSIPIFQDEANALARIAKTLTRSDLRQMMKLSDKLADLNYERFQRFSPVPGADEVRPAAFAFAGDTYTGLDAASLSDEDLDFAQDNFRILSGLYGLLRPLDAIQPYRLEMGRKLANPEGEDLYDFWSHRITRELDGQLAGHKSQTIVKLASNEYFKVIDRKMVKAQVLDVDFKEERGGMLRIIGIFAKRARGAMARYIIQNRIESPKELKEFAGGGYRFAPRLSSELHYVFTRRTPVR